MLAIASLPLPPATVTVPLVAEKLWDPPACKAADAPSPAPPCTTMLCRLPS